MGVTFYGGISRDGSELPILFEKQSEIDLKEGFFSTESKE